MNSHLENKILSLPFKHLTGINNNNLRVENKACLPKEAIGICHFDIAKDCKKDIARERWLQRLAKRHRGFLSSSNFKIKALFDKTVLLELQTFAL